MMLNGLQASSKTLTLDTVPAKFPSVDAEPAEPVTFGEILKRKEKQLQQEQEVSAASIVAAFAALQTPSLGRSLPIPSIKTGQETRETEGSQPTAEISNQSMVNVIETPGALSAAPVLTPLPTETGDADPPFDAVLDIGNPAVLHEPLTTTELSGSPLQESFTNPIEPSVQFTDRTLTTKLTTAAHITKPDIPVITSPNLESVQVRGRTTSEQILSPEKEQARMLFTSDELSGAVKISAMTAETEVKKEQLKTDTQLPPHATSASSLQPRINTTNPPFSFAENLIVKQSSETEITNIEAVSNQVVRSQNTSDFSETSTDTKIPPAITTTVNKNTVFKPIPIHVSEITLTEDISTQTVSLTSSKLTDASSENNLLQLTGELDAQSVPGSTADIASPQKDKFVVQPTSSSVSTSNAQSVAETVFTVSGDESKYDQAALSTFVSVPNWSSSFVEKPGDFMIRMKDRPESVSKEVALPDETIGRSNSYDAAKLVEVQGTLDNEIPGLDRNSKPVAPTSITKNNGDQPVKTSLTYENPEDSVQVSTPEITDEHITFVRESAASTAAVAQVSDSGLSQSGNINEQVDNLAQTARYIGGSKRPVENNTDSVAQKEVPSTTSQIDNKPVATWDDPSITEVRDHVEHKSTSRTATEQDGPGEAVVDNSRVKQAESTVTNANIASKTEEFVLHHRFDAERSTGEAKMSGVISTGAFDQVMMDVDDAGPQTVTGLEEKLLTSSEIKQESQAVDMSNGNIVVHASRNGPDTPKFKVGTAPVLTSGHTLPQPQQELEVRVFESPATVSRSGQDLAQSVTTKMDKEIASSFDDWDEQPNNIAARSDNHAIPKAHASSGNMSAILGAGAKETNIYLQTTSALNVSETTTASDPPLMSQPFQATMMNVEMKDREEQISSQAPVIADEHTGTASFETYPKVVTVNIEKDYVELENEQKHFKGEGSMSDQVVVTDHRKAESVTSKAALPEPENGFSDNSNTEEMETSNQPGKGIAQANQPEGSNGIATKAANVKLPGAQVSILPNQTSTKDFTGISDAESSNAETVQPESGAVVEKFGNSQSQPRITKVADPVKMTTPNRVESTVAQPVQETTPVQENPGNPDVQGKIIDIAYPAEDAREKSNTSSGSMRQLDPDNEQLPGAIETVDDHKLSAIFTAHGTGAHVQTVKIKQAIKDEQTSPVEKQSKVNQMPVVEVSSNTSLKEMMPVDDGGNVPSNQLHVDVKEVVQQLSHLIKSNLKNGPTSMHLQLNPRELGAIDVQMVSDSHGVHVTFFAEQASTGKLLETQLGQLRVSLVDSGVHLSGLDIGQHQQSGQKGGNFEQNPGFNRDIRLDLTEARTRNQEIERPETSLGQSTDIDYLI